MSNIESELLLTIGNFYFQAFAIFKDSCQKSPISLHNTGTHILRSVLENRSDFFAHFIIAITGFEEAPEALVSWRCHLKLSRNFTFDLKKLSRVLASNERPQYLDISHLMWFG
jgi:hypothetical protein